MAEKAPALRPGFKTSEFWLTLAAMIVGTLLSSGAISDLSTLGKALAFIASALAGLGYTVVRGKLKA